MITTLIAAVALLRLRIAATVPAAAVHRCLGEPDRNGEHTEIEPAGRGSGSGEAAS